VEEIAICIVLALQKEQFPLTSCRMSEALSLFLSLPLLQVGCGVPFPPTPEKRDELPHCSRIMFADLSVNK